MNTCAFLHKGALYRGSSPAIVYADQCISYREYYDRVLTLAGNLRALGLAPGDRVGFCLPNGPRIFELIYACFAAGLIVVPVNARLHPKEVAYIVDNSGARVLFADDELAAEMESLAGFTPALEHLIALSGDPGSDFPPQVMAVEHRQGRYLDVGPDAPAWLFYTSGTTGKPKGALWTYRTIHAVIMNYLADLYSIQPGEMVLHCAPLSHGSGIIALPAIARSACNVIYEQPSFDPASLFPLIERHRISHVAFMAPTQIVKCLEDFVPGHDLSSLRGVCYGGAPIYTEHLKKAMDTFGPVFVQLFGQGEAPITITGMSVEQHRQFAAADDPRLGSAGTIRTDVEACCMSEGGEPLPPGEIGEVAVRGEVVMAGYWNNPEATAEAIRDGWLFTGDIGLFDEDGYLFLLDRSKDVIISGGNNVYPREVEEVLVQHPDIANAVVIGIPDPYWGEAVHAVVILQPGKDLSARSIIDFCAGHMAGYKKPKGVDFVAEFPVSGYGKVLRREIRSWYWEEGKGQIGGGKASMKRADSVGAE